MSPESTTFHKYITLQSLNLIITNQVRNLRKVLEVQILSSSEFNCSGNKARSKRWYTMSWWSPYMTSLGTVIIGRSRIPFHRPTRGTVHGQVKLAIWSSNVSPENKVEPQARLSILILSKAYPTKGILSPLSRHAMLLAWGVCFCRKLYRVSPYFPILACKF